ncbi:hypothetical protein EDB89DRAFT_1397576 [Lactarius sanguifluus]|nr:hypothetical protein EDB89DRAFT_583801 [Lactarius sanguifluus]KAH9169826.1 hypothetical protein EDB89DRAFT_1397576 [Lactarius sanguifluus]
MRALSAPTLPAFDAELLAAAPATLTHSMLPMRSSTTFSPQLCVRVSRISHCPISLACHPLGAPRLAVLDSTPASRPRSLPAVRCTALRYVSPTRCTTAFVLRRCFACLEERLRCSYSCSRPMWTSRTRGRLLGALGNTGAGLELLELSLQMRSRCKRCTSPARCCRTCRRFPHCARRPRWRSRLPRRKKARHVSRCGGRIRRDRHHAASFFLRGRTGNSSGRNEPNSCTLFLFSFLFFFFSDFFVCISLSFNHHTHYDLNIFLRRVRVSPYRCHPHSPFVLIPGRLLLDILALQMSIVPSYIASYPLCT